MGLHHRKTDRAIKDGVKEKLHTDFLGDWGFDVNPKSPTLTYPARRQNREAGNIPDLILVQNGLVIPYIALPQTTAQMDWSKIELRVYAKDTTTAKGIIFLPGGIEVRALTLTKSGDSFKLETDPLKGKVTWKTSAGGIHRTTRQRISFPRTLMAWKADLSTNMETAALCFPKIPIQLLATSTGCEGQTSEVMVSNPPIAIDCGTEPGLVIKADILIYRSAARMIICQVFPFLP